MRHIRIGARGSRLSRVQAASVSSALLAAHPNLQITIVIFKTEGDRLLESPLPLIGGKGVFTEEIEHALLEGAIDVAVHSLKDLPVAQPDGLVIGAIPERGDVSDLLICRRANDLWSLPHQAVVGTSSLRRAAQLRAVRSDLQPRSIRGNVETRIKKLLDPAQNFDAIVLARAGVDRLRIQIEHSHVLEPEVMLPAPGQGALAVQCRETGLVRDLISEINHPISHFCTTAERAFLSGLGGGCSIPVAAIGTITGGSMTLRGRVSAVDGTSTIDACITGSCASENDARDIGADLATKAIEAGAREMLEAAV
ncbi:hydroxymethylbilane synthase [soil metagenome]